MKAPRRDELLLAIALQEANARNLGPLFGDFFGNADGDTVRADDPTLSCCCAVGALVLGGVCTIRDTADVEGEVVGLPEGFTASAISAGNDDCRPTWDRDQDDHGATMGHAFQLAMDGYRGKCWYR